MIQKTTNNFHVIFNPNKKTNEIPTNKNSTGKHKYFDSKINDDKLHLNKSNILKTYQIYNNTKIEIIKEENGCLGATVTKNEEIISVGIDWISGIPKEVWYDDQKLQQFFHNTNTYIRLNKLDNNGYHIYIYHQLKGGGLGGFLLGVGQVAAGTAITFYSGGAGMALGGSALISSGINGMIYGYKEKDCEPKEYIKKSAYGAVRGLVRAELGAVVGPLVHMSTVDVVNHLISGAIAGFGGKTTEILTEAIVEQDSSIITDPPVGEIILSTIAGAAIAEEPDILPFASEHFLSGLDQVAKMS